MKIIATTDISREGNDCYIHESISLTEQFGIYAIIRYLKIAGYPETEKVEVVLSSTNCGEVIEKFDKLGGQITG